MNSALILSFKKRSETMAIHVARIRDEAGIPQDIAITYAGRLDPMAEGLVLLLVGELRYQKNRFLQLSKTYTVRFFTGYHTDTYDILGIARPGQAVPQESVTQQLSLFLGRPYTHQLFPAYSSRKFAGQSLFHYARAGAAVPAVTHDVELFSATVGNSEIISRTDFIKKIQHDICQVTGDFRQELCSDAWYTLADTVPLHIPLYQITVMVGSGFYVRQWVADFGDFCGSGAVTFSINRDTIGIFTMSMMNGGSYRIFSPDELDSMMTNQ